MVRYKDLTGSKYGRLTVLGPTDKRDKKGSCIFRCRCDCGNIIDVASDRLVSGNTTSCGCRKKENNRNIKNTLHFVDGTCVEWIRSRKHRSDNTTGYTGVYRYKNKYRVYIGLQKKKYYCGTHDTLEEAVRVRREAEEAVHEQFLRSYEKYKKESQGEEWEKEHPFNFDVAFKDGEFTVKTSWDKTSV